MVPVVARHGRGIEALLDTVIAVYENEDDRVRHIHINQGPVIEESLRTIAGALKESGEPASAIPAALYRYETARGRQLYKGPAETPSELPRMGGDEQAGSATDHQPVG